MKMTKSPADLTLEEVVEVLRQAEDSIIEQKAGLVADPEWERLCEEAISRAKIDVRFQANLPMPAILLASLLQRDGSKFTITIKMNPNLLWGW